MKCAIQVARMRNNGDNPYAIRGFAKTYYGDVMDGTTKDFEDMAHVRKFVRKTFKGFQIVGYSRVVVGNEVIKSVIIAEHCEFWHHMCVLYGCEECNDLDTYAEELGELDAVIF